MKKRLTKSKNNRLIFGVIGGIGEYFDLDENLITIMRIVYVLLAFMMGFGFLLYIVMAMIIPSDDRRKDSNQTYNSYNFYDQPHQESQQGRKMKKAEPVDEQDDWSDF